MKLNLSILTDKVYLTLIMAKSLHPPLHPHKQMPELATCSTKRDFSAIVTVFCPLSFNFKSNGFYSHVKKLRP